MTIAFFLPEIFMYYPLEATFSGNYELIALFRINIIRQINDMKMLFSKVFMPLCFLTNPSLLRVVIGTFDKKA